MYSNAEKLASVLSYWARPAISQIAAGRLGKLEVMKQVQGYLVANGLVGNGYRIEAELMPFVNNIADAIMQPMLAQWLWNVPDEALPELARGIVETALQQPKFSLLDGLVEFTKEDLEELKDLLEKNLPVEEKVRYEVRKE